MEGKHLETYMGQISWLIGLRHCLGSPGHVLECLGSSPTLASIQHSVNTHPGSSRWWCTNLRSCHPSGKPRLNFGFSPAQPDCHGHLGNKQIETLFLRVSSCHSAFQINVLKRKLSKLELRFYMSLWVLVFLIIHFNKKSWPTWIGDVKSQISNLVLQPR